MLNRRESSTTALSGVRYELLSTRVAATAAQSRYGVIGDARERVAPEDSACNPGHSATIREAQCILVGLERGLGSFIVPTPSACA